MRSRLLGSRPLLPGVGGLFAMAALLMGPAHGAAQAREATWKPCDASDCDSFDSFYGPYVGMFVGGRRLKVGARALLARRDRINGGADWVGHIEPLIGRVTLAW